MIAHLGHLVLTTIDLDACKDFYTRMLGMPLETFGEGRVASRFGQQKINGGPLPRTPCSVPAPLAR